MRQRSRHSLLPLAALGAAVLALLWVAVAPIAAWAADYRCTEVDLVAQVQTDGSVSVVDQRIFEFDGAEIGRAHV